MNEKANSRLTDNEFDLVKNTYDNSVNTLLSLFLQRNLFYEELKAREVERKLTTINVLSSIIIAMVGFFIPLTYDFVKNQNDYLLKLRFSTLILFFLSLSFTGFIMSAVSSKIYSNLKNEQQENENVFINNSIKKLHDLYKKTTDGIMNVNDFNQYLSLKELTYEKIIMEHNKSKDKRENLVNIVYFYLLFSFLFGSFLLYLFIWRMFFQYDFF